jgi:hypothetical protein
MGVCGNIFKIYSKSSFHLKNKIKRSHGTPFHPKRFEISASQTCIEGIETAVGYRHRHDIPNCRDGGVVGLGSAP